MNISDTLWQDFTTAKYTAVISDLHLCEAEPIHPKFPLWKKFKTREFFFDEALADFLEKIVEKAAGQQVELVLNGDIFDFDSVTSIPDQPVFQISRLEKKRGLLPQAERSTYKIKMILQDHHVFIQAIKKFVADGHRVIFIIGNHDIELHFSQVQTEILNALSLDEDSKKRIRFTEWFYISNKDTLIEHGNQYDPYCVCEDPIHPYVRGYNFISLKLPFGNLACRYIMNGMGFFNPHVDSNYIMSLGQYIRFFFKYMIRAQPDLILIWLWGSLVTLKESFVDRLASPIRNPLKIEDRIKEIAMKANAETRVVRELKELFVDPASSRPYLLVRELWLDRAFFIFLSFYIIFQLMVFVRSIFNVSFFWAFVPLFALLPFFLFYSKSIISRVSNYKEPDDHILAMTSAITGVQRVIYGHTHLARHEYRGAVEHLNSGCWSPAFLDLECTKPIDQKTFVWIAEQSDGLRTAELFKFKNNSWESLSRGSKNNATHE